jgi:hypothetical protein
LGDLDHLQAKRGDDDGGSGSGTPSGQGGKSASQPASARRDAVPVQGEESAAHLEQALDKRM